MTEKKIPEFSVTLRKVILFSVFLLFFSFVVSINVVAAKTEAQAASNEDLTYFQTINATLQDGSGTFTAEDMKNYQITVINGWAPWCHNCVGEMPALQQLSTEYADKGLQVVGVVADYYENQSAEYDASIQKTIDNLGITYPIVLSDEDFHNNVKPIMNGCFPATWVLDSEGNVIDFISGGNEHIEYWQEYFDRWLAGETWIGA